MKLDLLEKNRTRRGHPFFWFDDDTPELYDTEEVAMDDKTIWAHFFGPSQDWYIAELDPETGEAMGYCDLGLGFPEWGYVFLPELEEVLVGFTIIERDCHWVPKPFKEIKR